MTQLNEIKRLKKRQQKIEQSMLAHLKRRIQNVARRMERKKKNERSR